MIDLDTAAIQINSEQVDIPNASEPALRDDTDIKSPVEMRMGKGKYERYYREWYLDSLRSASSASEAPVNSLYFTTS